MQSFNQWLHLNVSQGSIAAGRSLKKEIPLFIIPYWNLNRIPEILDDILNGRVPIFSEPPDNSRRDDYVSLKNKKVKKPVLYTIFNLYLLY